jgi:enoyl-CoA hydratase/carnithine racemase
MPYQHMTVERAQHVATLTLNRPEAYNSLNMVLGRELFAASLELDEDPDVRCIVITGAGRAFCATWGASAPTSRS